jgi:adenosylhomocysteine nucleosidase
VNKTKNPTFGLIVALRGEIAPFLRRATQVRRLRGPFPAWHFHLEDHSGVAVESGMGAGAARQATLTLINSYSPRLIISLGFGGAFSPGLPSGAVVLGREYWDYNLAGETLQTLATIPPAWPLGQLILLLQSAQIPAFPGVLVSTSEIISKSTHSGALLHLPNPVLDLETFTVAQVARERKLPFLGIRAITDTGEEEIADFLRAQISNHPKISIRETLAAVLKKPIRLAYLIKLGLRARLASNRLAQALVTLLPVLAKARANHGERVD